jgi:hypothetical protein
MEKMEKLEKECIEYMDQIHEDWKAEYSELVRDKNE